MLPGMEVPMSVSETKAAPEGGKADQSPVVVKKYANRRLYNTESSSYITLDSLAGMIRIGRDFVVYDAKTGEDITRSVLTQIIVEEESKGRAMLPTAFLRQIIGFYGDNLQQFVPSYLEQAMASFATQQEQMRAAMQKTMGNLFPGMQDISRQNMEMMERAMSMFTPFYRGPQATAVNGQAPMPEPDTSEVIAMKHEIDVLRQQLAAARAQAAPNGGHSEATGAKEPTEPVDG
jgi:polyhydroxyalkanoate synthesis repressor PhaR